MEIQDFFTRLLGLGLPWCVENVASGDGAEKIDVYVECVQMAQSPCPRCSQIFPVTGHSPVRTWRHLDTSGITTYLHAQLPVVDCSEHGKQISHPPWAEADSPLSSAFEQLVTRLAGEFGDIRKAALFFRLDQAAVRHIQRSAAKATEKVKERAADAPRDTSNASFGPQIRQASLFEQNDMSFANRGILAFRNLELEKAVEYLQTHRKLYPKGYDVTSRLAAAEFMLQGLQGTPDECPDRFPQ